MFQAMQPYLQVRYIEVYLPTFGHFQTNHSGIFRILSQLEIFIYIRVYSKPNGLFKHIQNRRPRLIQLFRYYSRAIYAYCQPYLGRSRDIQQSGLFRRVKFHPYSGIFAKLIYRDVFAHIQSYFSRFRHIQYPGITVNLK